MIKFWYWVYNIILLPLFWLIFNIVSIFNEKARIGIKGRRDTNKILESIIPALNSCNKKKVIIHCSSLGEYQQSLPLVEQLINKNYKIIITFFSPSGYNNAKLPYNEITKLYIPFDSIPQVKKFLNLLNPDLIILMRYDLWFNFLYQARKRKIKIIVANARFDEKDIFWKSIIASSFKKAMYRMVDIIFVIDEDDEINFKKKLKKYKSKIILVGDSKYERVYQTLKDFKGENVIPEQIYKDKKVFVIGSSWKDDEDVVLPVIDRILCYEKNLLTVLVPHEPKETKISAIEKKISTKFRNLSFIRYSELNKYNNQNLIIVDSIGKLSKLYSIAYLSYVGGGFRTGLHNILEPIIFNVPVFFSNLVKNSDEDELLLRTGCGILVKDKRDFYRKFRELLSDRKKRDELSKKCNEIFRHTLGTAEKIINHLTLN
ncbi:MAG: hypothetical protein N2490_03150 [Ignavibacteria bacterium]|nr:hypothetical protein [Ignavibacteria bacterium]